MACTCLEEMGMFSRSHKELGIMEDEEEGACSCCKEFLRFIVLFLQAVVLIGAISCLAIGIYTHEVEYGSRQLSSLIGVSMYRADSVMMIGGGAAIIAITLLGFIGAYRQHKCMVGMYLCIFVFLALMVFAAGILGYIFIAQLEDNVRKSMEESLKKHYGVVVDKKKNNEDITKSWDSIQQSFQCCGAYGSENSSHSWALYQQETFWFIDRYSNGSLVPESCCLKKSPIDQHQLDLCTGKIQSDPNWPPTKLPPVLETPLNYTLYTVGCYDKLHDYLIMNGIMIGTAAIVVGVFMIVLLTFGIIFYRNMNSS